MVDCSSSRDKDKSKGRSKGWTRGNPAIAKSLRAGMAKILYDGRKDVCSFRAASLTSGIALLSPEVASL